MHIAQVSNTRERAMRRLQALSCSPRLLLSDERGSAGIIVALTLPILVGLTAFAVDIPHFQHVKDRLQTVADSAAHAGAIALPDTTKAKEQALVLAAANTPAGYGKVTTESDVILGRYDKSTRTFKPQSELSGTELVNAVKVFSHRSAATNNAIPRFFSKIFGNEDIGLVASAIAMRANSSVCILALDKTTVTGFDVGGSSTVLAPGCGVHVNANGSFAARVGNSGTAEAESFCVVGGATGDFRPAAQTGCPVLEDPFRATFPLVPEDTITYNKDIPEGKTSLPNLLVLCPGVYSNITVRLNGSKSTLFANSSHPDCVSKKVKTPDLHYFKKVNLIIESSHSVTSDKVLLYFDKETTLKMTSSGKYTFNAPETGPWKGFAIAQSGDAKVYNITHDVRGSNYSSINGIWYTPGSNLSMAGNSTAEIYYSGSIVMNKFGFSGGATLKMVPSTGAGGLGLGKGVAFVD